MTRFLLGLVCLLWATASSAANTVEWTDLSDNPGCSLDKGCCRVAFTATTTGESKFLFTGKRPITLQWEPDVTGNDVVATADAMACTTLDGNADGVQDVNSCKPYRVLDSDGNGIVDTNTFTFASIWQQAAYTVGLGGWLYIDPVALPVGTDVAQMVVCQEMIR